MDTRVLTTGEGTEVAVCYRRFRDNEYISGLVIGDDGPSAVSVEVLCNRCLLVFNCNNEIQRFSKATAGYTVSLSANLTCKCESLSSGMFTCCCLFSTTRGTTNVSNTHTHTEENE